MSMEQWWNDTDRGKLKYWEKKSFAVPPCAPQIPSGLVFHPTRRLFPHPHIFRFYSSSTPVQSERCHWMPQFNVFLFVILSLLQDSLRQEPIRFGCCVCCAHIWSADFKVLQYFVSALHFLGERCFRFVCLKLKLNFIKFLNRIYVYCCHSCTFRDKTAC